MITLTLTYADSSTWIAGGFPTMDAANAWIANEQLQPYWISTTTYSIINNTSGS